MEPVFMIKNPTGSLRGVVLAGGESSRFGGDDDDKALARVGSLTFLSRILSVISQATEQQPILVVRTTEHHERYSEIVRDDEVTFAFDEREHDGPLAGMVGAATNVDARWLFCCGCDMPLLAESAIRWFIHQLVRRTTDGRRIDALAIEYPDGVAEPLHTIYRRESIIEIQRHLSQSDGLQSLFSELPHVCTLSLADVPEDIPLEQSTTNVNTLEELKLAQDRWRRL